MVRPRKMTNDPAVAARRLLGRQRQHRYANKNKKMDPLPPRTELMPTSPEVLHFELPAPRFPATPSPANKHTCTTLHGKPRDPKKERFWCARSRHKNKMLRVLVELEETLVKLKDIGFTRQKRGKRAGSSFQWLYQFDVYNHSVRHRLQSGYEISHPDTRRHNIESRALPHSSLRVRLRSRQQMLDILEGTEEQKELQQASWDLVDKLVDGIPPLKEWAGANSDYKVQFSMMDDCAKHAVKPHFDSGDIAPQFSICLGEYTGGELLTWDKGKDHHPLPHLSTDVRNKLLFFDGRLKHAANTWKGKYRINVAFYKHYDRRWTQLQPVQERPLLVYDFNKKIRN
jgi:hypothetical protein